MTIRLDAWMDFTCPFCFVTSLTLKQLACEYPLEIHWRSFQVRPPGSLPQSEESRAISEADRKEAAKRAKNQFGKTFRPGPIGMNTRLPHIELRFAESAGKADAFYWAAMEAYWLNGRAIDTPESIRKIATQIGLEENAAMFALTNQKLSHQVDADRYEAEGLGLRVIPALVFDQTRAYSGEPSYQELRKFIENLPRELGNSAAVGAD